MTGRVLGALLACALLGSCGWIQKAAVKTTASIIYDASFEIETETNWDNYRYGVMPNLKLMEGFLHVDKKNENLLVSLIKGYASYAFAINETLYLEDLMATTWGFSNGHQGKEVFSGKNDLHHRSQAISNYERALEYGFRYFELHGLPEKKLMGFLGKEKELKRFLSDNFTDEKSYEAVLFTAQAMSGLINLQRDRMDLVVQLPIVKSLFDWVCCQKPDINHGVCKIFFAAYEVARPRILGGNPEKSKEIFLAAMDEYSDNWLIHIGYIQFYLIPMREEDGFKKMMAEMSVYKNEFQKSHRWRPGKSEKVDENNKRILFYQALALKRYDIINHYAGKIFQEKDKPKR